MTIPVKASAGGEIMESVLLKGDLAKLTPEERTRYYNEVCRSLGLNPLTQPFAYITLNGRLQLYALRACADQLRKINGVSLEIVSREVNDGILTVHVRAKLLDGRVDEDLGSVPFPDELKGEGRANAELKAVTKAKRRATLSICGLGWLDETEIESIPASAKRPAPAPNVLVPPHDADTGEIIETAGQPAEAAPASHPVPRTPAAGAAAPSESDRLAAHDRALAAAAENGWAALASAWESIDAADQKILRAALNNRHKQTARAADKAKAPA